MARLIYSSIMSLDGYIADEKGSFGWAAPDDEVHAFINELELPVGTYLYRRGMYEVMSAWEAVPADEGQPAAMRDYERIWRAADKVVFSRTLREASTARTRLWRDFDPDAVRLMKTRSAHDLSVGGPELAALAFRAGLVDECHVFIVPVTVGGGNRSFRDARVALDLMDARRFQGGFVHLHYRVQG
jgi:dihydrofolate reductase